jgi:hypothetical protein
LKDSATIVANAASMAKDIKGGNGFDAIADDIIGASDTIKFLIDDCENSVCLDKAYDRCVKDNRKVGCEQNGAVVYPKCRAGYNSVGCCLCSTPCPAGWRDDGIYCFKPESYGRGGGYPWQFGDALNLDGARGRCERDNRQGCEQDGAIMYPRCRANFHKVGCCICSPDCPAGWVDAGISCKKDIYGRGFGYPWKKGDCEPTDFLTDLDLKKNERPTVDKCTPDLLLELGAASQSILSNKDDPRKLMEAVYDTAGVMSKIKSVCPLPKITN